jgi:hypothetical protein
MIQAFLPRSYRIFAAVLVAAFCIGFSLTAAGQASGPVGSLVGGLGGAHVAAGHTSAPNLPAGALTGIAGSREEGGQETASGMNQNLKMHGHWIIDIKNPDGTLVQHHEFENAIQYDGQNYLVGLMSGYGAAGPWEIYFSNATATSAGSPCNTAEFPYCASVYSTASQPGLFSCSVYTCAGGLTITPKFGVGPTLTLTGSIAATQAGSIGFVATGMSACGGAAGPSGYPTAISTITPTACYTSTTSSFGGTATSTTLGVPISVAQGQIIQVTVVLSFS